MALYSSRGFIATEGGPMYIIKYMSDYPTRINP